MCYKRGWMDEARRYYERRCRWTRATRNISALDRIKRNGAAYRPNGYGHMSTGSCAGDNLHQPLRRLRLHELPVWRRRILFLLLRDDR